MTDKLRKGTEQICKMVASGIDIEEAYQLVKPGRELTKKAKHDMLAKAATYSLTNPKRVKKASQVVDKILAGQAIDKEGKILPKSSDVVRIIEMIKDREEPKVTINQNLNVNIDASPVNLDKYRIQPVDNIVDISVDNSE